MCKNSRRTLTNVPMPGYNTFYCAGVVQRPVHQPSKLRTRVRLPSPAPNSDPRGVSRHGGRCLVAVKRSRTGQPGRSQAANSPVDCWLGRGRLPSPFPRNDPLGVSRHGGCCLVAVKRSRTGRPGRSQAANSPVDCWLGRGRLPSPFPRNDPLGVSRHGGRCLVAVKRSRTGRQSRPVFISTL